LSKTKTKRMHTKLIRTIWEHGCYSDAGRDATAELVNGGESALDAFLLARDHAVQSNLHPRDLSATISNVYSGFARRNPDALIDRFESGKIDALQVFWALGSATGERSIDVLVVGLKSKEKWSRWAAATSLIERKCIRAAAPLLERLNDRSTLVTFVVVEAMRSNRKFRCPEAIPALERLIASKSIQKHSPGTFKMAKEVVRLIKKESF
jgi:HEAT repeat protein